MEHLDQFLTVAMFIAGMFWADYTKRGDRQGHQSVDVARMASRVEALEHARDEHDAVATSVTRLEEQVGHLREEIANFRRALEDAPEGRWNAPRRRSRA